MVTLKIDLHSPIMAVILPNPPIVPKGYYIYI